MKKLFGLIVLSAASILHAEEVPTPEMAADFGLNLDSTQWVAGHQASNRNGFILELVPEGQKIEAWVEMVAVQVIFTARPLEDHVGGWKEMVLRGDPDVEIEQEHGEDGSIVITYISKKFNEHSIRKFMPGKDGVYVVAYHIRLTHEDRKRLDLWREIIAKARLRPNPARH